MNSNAGGEATVETAVVEALIAGAGRASTLLDAEIFVALGEIAGRRRALDAAVVELAAELLARGDTTPVPESPVRRAGYRSVPETLQHLLATRRVEARAIADVAEAVRTRVGLTGAPIAPEYPRVGQALAQAQVSLAQAFAIVRGLAETGGRADPADLDIAEQHLVASACGADDDDSSPMTPESLAVQASAWVAHLDPDGDEPRVEVQASRRGLSFSRRSDGMIVGKLLATPEQGEALRVVLDAYVAPRRVQFECNAEAAAASADACAADADVVDQRSTEQRRIDALVAIVGRHAETASAPRVGGDAPTLVITVTRDGLREAATCPTDQPRLEYSNEAVPVSEAARLLCDGIIRVALVDDDGETLRLGRERRLFNRAQRRAIAVRDGGCRAPGCAAPVGWCEAHHVTSWAEGGPTDVENGILLCSFHHHEVHRGRLRIDARQGGDPRGRWKVSTDFAHPGFRVRRPRRAARRGTPAGQRAPRPSAVPRR